MVAALRPRRTVTTALSRSTAPRRRWLTGATSHTCVRSTLTPSALTQPSRCPGRSSRGRRPVTAPLPHPARCHWTATALATPPIWGSRTGITSCCGTSRAKRAPPSRGCSGWRAARRGADPPSEAHAVSRPQALTVGIRQAIAICAAHHTGDAHCQPQPGRGGGFFFWPVPSRRPADHRVALGSDRRGRGGLRPGARLSWRRSVGTACAPADSWPRAPGSRPPAGARGRSRSTRVGPGHSVE